MEVICLLIHALKDYDADDSEVYDNVIYLNDKAQEIETLKQDSSSEGDYVDSLDTVHETTKHTGNSNLTSDLNVPACSIVKSSSFSGVTEREILRNKVKELYNLYNELGSSAMMSSLQDVQPQTTNDTQDQSIRAGKYHKKAAPHPPKTTEKEDSGTSAIKATLVLKPGIIKTLPPLTDTSKSEIFLSHSPKAKRKSKSPMSRLMMLPKKMVFWNKDETKQADDKRFSWNMFSGGSQKQQLKPFTKQYSKSHEDLQNTRKFDYLCDEDLLSYNSIRKEDHYRVRKLSASSTFCRRIDELELN